MSNIEKRARNILALHECAFVEMIGECVVVWKNNNGCQFAHDIFVLNHLPEDVWDHLCSLTDL